MQFGDEITALKEAGATCICYDMLGGGRNRKPRLTRLEDQLQLYSPQAHYADLELVLKQFILNKVTCTTAEGWSVLLPV